MPKRIWVEENSVPQAVRDRGTKSITGYVDKRQYLGARVRNFVVDDIELIFEPQGKYTALRYMAHCTCQCVNRTPKVLLINNILTGTTYSCGCINDQKRRSKRKFDPLEKVLLSRLRTLSDRCYADKVPLEKRWDYAEVGTVKAVANLLADMGQPPSPQHVLGRRDHSAPWNKRNCEWTTRDQIAAKRRGQGWKNGNWTFGKDTYKREYSRVWSMNDRCYNPNNKAYPRYGGRGIGVCNRWRFDKVGAEMAVANFMSDMGTPPTELHSLERKDNNLGYSHQNCRWATEREQANNRSSNVVYNYYGKRYTRTELARELADEFDYDFTSIRAKLASTGHSPAWIVRWIRRRKLAAQPT